MPWLGNLIRWLLLWTWRAVSDRLGGCFTSFLRLVVPWLGLAAFLCFRCVDFLGRFRLSLLLLLGRCLRCLFGLWLLGRLLLGLFGCLLILRSFRVLRSLRILWLFGVLRLLEVLRRRLFLARLAVRVLFVLCARLAV